MNKPLGVLAGIVIVVGALNTAGAWYTGSKIEGVLQAAIEQSNQELATQLQGSTTHGTLELVSIERNLYSSTAHSRQSSSRPRHKQPCPSNAMPSHSR